MYVKTLMDWLKTSYGEPTQLERQDAFRWQIRVPGDVSALAGIHLCVTLEQQTRKVAIWMFDPHAEDSTRYFHIQTEREMNEAMAVLQRSLPQIVPPNALMNS
jgi:hypothetical protein